MGWIETDDSAPAAKGWAGTLPEREDVRPVVAAIPRVVKDDLRYDAVPWARFDHAYGSAQDVPALLETVRLGDARASEGALSTLWNSLAHQGGTSTAGALAVPFLLRIAFAHPRHRASLVRLTASVAHRMPWGDGTRGGLLRVGLPADRPRYEQAGSLANRSIEAARSAVATDAALLLHLLDDPDPEVRHAVAQAAAVVPPPAPVVAAVLRGRLAVEDDPAVRASLVLALGQLAWETRDPATTEAMHAWWRDEARPPEVRVGAALAWLCLTDDPIPADLDAFLDTTVTDDLVELLAAVPWLDAVEDLDERNGLLVCLHQMRHPEDFAWLAD
ncbi:HEAT repeat domain-containing protein [Kitasatospora sp. NPDC059827]|uniref:HEAT repeat domain-containing protein n=1 Tax=Kitasatospora sp. NPDC059827 TaxID=3346964 RepID=UPI003662660C